MVERTTDKHGDGSQADARRRIEFLQAELDALLGHASSGVVVYEPVKDGQDFLIVDFNRAAEEIEQVKKKDLLGKSVLDVFPGVKEFGLFEVFRQVWQTGEPQDHPVSVYKDDRITGWRRNHVCRLPNGQIMAVYDDVTASKRSELATRMSEQRFRAIANYTYDWEVWVGPTGRVFWLNPAACRISGYEMKELLTMRDYPGPLVYESDRERVMQQFGSAVAGSTGSEEFRLQRKDGTTVWVEMSWQPIYDDKDNPLGHRESIRDITSRKQAEHAAELAQREKEAILDNMAERVVYLGADRSILWANRAACESMGIARDQVIGCSSTEVRAEWHESWGGCPAADAMESGHRIEAEKPASDGRTWLVQAAPVHDRGGAIIGGVEIVLDISDRKRT